MSHVETTELRLPPDHNLSGKVSWQCPSNIALVKYWGKHPVQIPINPSISFTLSKAFSETTLEYRPGEWVNGNVGLTFRFDGKENKAFEQRIGSFLKALLPEFPFLDQLHLIISSTNSFPHSSGIASSASAMGALALCLCDLEKTLFQSFDNASEFQQKASRIARLGSGSACRSVFSIAAVWGKSPAIEGSSNDYAIPFGDQIHPVFRTFKDSILIASSSEKSVSSSAGHQLMERHLFRETRLAQANDNILLLTEAMRSGDLDAFGLIVEEEALTLHALMMTSRPSYILLQPATLQMIDRIRKFRRDRDIPVFFTLDAGPNIHLLYPEERKQAVQPFIKEALQPLCEEDYWIDDEAGVGPLKIN